MVGFTPTFCKIEAARRATIFANVRIALNYSPCLELGTRAPRRLVIGMLRRVFLATSALTLLGAAEAQPEYPPAVDLSRLRTEGLRVVAPAGRLGLAEL